MRDQDMPDSVRYFERLVYAAMIIFFCEYFLHWNRTIKHLTDEPVQFVITQSIFFCIQFLWIWLVVYRRLNWARWTTLLIQFIMVLIVGINVDARVHSVNWYVLVFSLRVLTYLLATCFLFTRDATLWFVPQRT
ncbi:hypothetical protein [Rhizobium sp. ICMP 5592]|uniref:hypothetical protein n=1 Tax=Rhizobium sp. ICMP 5592 TaxID=2292445 RepID=UPI001295E166|nr:hypothetical protein [Rhizobium sp. ICMP 5592]MQB41915.1 hypothetical protein [Rhizobium sp. ICMP 5592]